jgi:hypothetical protein
MSQNFRATGTHLSINENINSPKPLIDLEQVMKQPIMRNKVGILQNQALEKRKQSLEQNP